MALTHVLLFFHLLGAVCFFGGGAVAGTLQLAAIRRERPSEIAALLRSARLGVVLVGVGALLTLGFGIGLAQHEGVGLSPAWIQASLGLWVAAMALGAYGGRTARHARYLAQKLASEGDAPSTELRSLVSARVPLAASYASMACLLAILGLMVWQPGSRSAAVPAWVQTKIVRDNPRLAYVPTRLPVGYSFSQYSLSPIGGHFRLHFEQPHTGTRELIYTVDKRGDCVKKPVADGRLEINGTVAFYGHTATVQRAWTCRGGVSIEAWSPVLRHVFDSLTDINLATVVAYAAPIR